MRATQHEGEAHRGHVVCVNSSHELLEMMCLLLVDEGYHPTPLPVTPDTIDEIRRLSPDAMILDLISSDETSWRLIEQVNHDPATSGIPSIIVSTDPRALELVRSEPHRFGGDLLLPKPFDVFELCDQLERLLYQPSDRKRTVSDSEMPPRDAR